MEERITVMVPRKLKEAAWRKAAAKNTKVSQVVRDLLTKWLEGRL